MTGVIDYRFFQWLRDDGSGNPILYDKSNQQLIKVSHSGGKTTMTGAEATGDDFQIMANSNDATAYIKMNGLAGFAMAHAVGSAFGLFDGSTYYFRTAYASNVTSIIGGPTSGDDLKLKGSNADDYPYINLAGNGEINISSKGHIQFNSEAVYLGKITSEKTLMLLETTTPTALANSGQFYTKNDNLAYFQDGAGAEHTLAFA